MFRIGLNDFNISGTQALWIVERAVSFQILIFVDFEEPHTDLLSRINSGFSIEYQGPG